MQRLSAPVVRNFKMIRMRKPGIYSAADEAHNGQPKVNALKDIRPKNGFFRPLIPESI
jgi:hypothetical protein